VALDVRGVIQVRSAASPPAPHPYPERVEGIAVGRIARRLHFLHATQQPGSDGTEIGRYVVHLANGQSEILPLRYGENLRDWWRQASESPLPSHTIEAWSGSNPEAAAFGTTIRLFRWTWVNPSPDVPIVCIDLVSGNTACEPFLVAVTAE
jgi:hypothetical protein